MQVEGTMYAGRSRPSTSRIDSARAFGVDVVRDDSGHSGIAHEHNGNGIHVVLAPNSVLDFAKFYAVAAVLDLGVNPSPEEQSVIVNANKIAAPIPVVVLADEGRIDISRVPGEYLWTAKE